ncbi:MAG: hypothetical protein AB7J13_15155 [Pyrinomonadaceae bacterium]
MHRTEYIENDPFEQDRYNERMDFIEDFCATLVESRFGPGRTSRLVINLSDEPEVDRGHVFYDLSDGLLVPCYEVSPYGRTHYQVMEIAYRRYKEARLAAGRTNTASANHRSPSNSARGSPNSASPRLSSASPLRTLATFA